MKLALINPNPIILPKNINNIINVFKNVGKLSGDKVNMFV